MLKRRQKFRPEWLRRIKDREQWRAIAKMWADQRRRDLDQRRINTEVITAFGEDGKEKRYLVKKQK